ncbi:protein phosphatase 2C domain-containing protein [Acetobacteraceae bacterium]|nr:protein phosphatase 2C domain-containing protein [Acetobacteraceae bacterium]
MMKPWRWMQASKIGTSHLKNQTALQDACVAFPISPPLFSKRKDFWFSAIVCDGAGSTSHGGEGAQIACRFLKEKIRRYFKKSSILPSETILRGWVLETRQEIARQAEKSAENLSLKDFACTLVLFLGNGTQQICAHIGDGAIVTCDATQSWECFSAPHHGEYASTTYFLTDKTLQIRVSTQSKEIKGICVFSDGLEGLALNLSNNTPHQPFFQTLSRPLEKSLRRNKVGCDKFLSKGLGELLLSEKVCSRTDDDKTLIFALVK